MQFQKIQTRYTSSKTILKVATGEDQAKKIRILALHGKGGSGPEFQTTLQPFISALEYHFTKEDKTARKVEFDFLTAPFDGGQWWKLPPGVRSFNAKEYEGFELSASEVEKKISASEQGGYDIILGHSQGAILLAALMARNDSFLKSCLDSKDDTSNVGFILNGAAWPNPYTPELESFDLSQIETECTCLFVVGKRDTMNPPEGARKVREYLEKGGMKVSTVDHPGGHSVPVGDDEAVKGIIEWIDTFIEE